MEPLPGWYPDPTDGSHGAQHRWWNGTAWTAHVRSTTDVPASRIASLTTWDGEDHGAATLGPLATNHPRDGFQGLDVIGPQSRNHELSVPETQRGRRMPALAWLALVGVAAIAAGALLLRSGEGAPSSAASALLARSALGELYDLPEPSAACIDHVAVDSGGSMLKALLECVEPEIAARVTFAHILGEATLDAAGALCLAPLARDLDERTLDALAGGDIDAPTAEALAPMVDACLDPAARIAAAIAEGGALTGERARCVADEIWQANGGSAGWLADPSAATAVDGPARC